MAAKQMSCLHPYKTDVEGACADLYQFRRNKGDILKDE